MCVRDDILIQTWREVWLFHSKDSLPLIPSCGMVLFGFVPKILLIYLYLCSLYYWISVSVSCSDSYIKILLAGLLDSVILLTVYTSTLCKESKDSPWLCGEEAWQVHQQLILYLLWVQWRPVLSHKRYVQCYVAFLCWLCMPRVCAVACGM